MPVVKLACKFMTTRKSAALRLEVYSFRLQQGGLSSPANFFENVEKKIVGKSCWKKLLENSCWQKLWENFQIFKMFKKLLEKVVEKKCWKVIEKICWKKSSEKIIEKIAGKSC